MSEYTDDPYKELGVEPTDDSATIKKAYRKLALQYHPDRAGGDTAKFARIANAYEILTDDHLRAEYDRSVSSAPFDDDSSLEEEGNNADSNTKKKKAKKKASKKKRSNQAAKPFRYHFSDPYEVWKRDFKDMHGIEYPGAQYDWVSHDDSKANDFIDQHVKTNPTLQNGQASTGSPKLLQDAPKETAKPKRRGFASLFRRKNKAEKEPVPSSTALVPVSSSPSSALVPSNGSKALAVPGSAPVDNSQALVVSSGRNNRPISMDVKTVQDGPVTVTTTTLVRPDGSTETITMRSGLPGPAPNKKLALTNGETPKLALTNGNEKKALPNSTSKSTKKEKKALKGGKSSKKDKKKALAIENGTKALVPVK